MNKSKLLILVAIILLLGGGATWFVKNKNTDKENTNTSSSSENADSGSASAFNPLSASGFSYVSTITSTLAGEESVAIMEYDKNTDAIRYTTSSNGEKTIMIVAKDSVYMCQTADNCIKYPNGSDDTSGFDRGAYEYTPEEIEGWKNTAMDQGVKDCPAGKCNVWQVSADGYDNTVYIDTKTRRISMVETSSPNGSSKMVYEYKDVSIEIPVNAQTFEVPNIPQ